MHPLLHRATPFVRHFNLVLTQSAQTKLSTIKEHRICTYAVILSVCLVLKPSPALPYCCSLLHGCGCFNSLHVSRQQKTPGCARTHSDAKWRGFRERVQGSAGRGLPLPFCLCGKVEADIAPCANGQGQAHLPLTLRSLNPLS